jgi:ABC-type taurine transport system ATPase subunit
MRIDAMTKRQLRTLLIELKAGGVSVRDMMLIHQIEDKLFGG